MSSTVDDPVTSTYLSDFLVCPDDRQASPDKKTEPLLTLLADVDKYLLLFEQLIRANRDRSPRFEQTNGAIPMSASEEGM